MSQARCFSSNTFENIINETVHDTHGFTGNTSVWMNLLQHFVDVDSITFLTLAFLLFVSLRNILLCLTGLLRCFSACFWWHVDSTIYTLKLNHRKIVRRLYTLSIKKLAPPIHDE